MAHNWPRRSRQREFSERSEPPCTLELLGGPEEEGEKESLLITCSYLSIHSFIHSTPKGLEEKQTEKQKLPFLGFPGGAVVKNPPANAGDTGSSPGPGRSHMPRSN